MIHFFPLFADDPSDSPFAKELARLGVPHRLFGKALSFHYKRRLGLILMGWPRLILFAGRSAWRSMFQSSPKPTAVVLASHFEVLIFGLASLLLARRNRPSIVLVGFIYTSRPNSMVRRLRELYFGMVFSVADMVVCHSMTELSQYGKIFSATRNKFRFIPYGSYVSGEEAYQTDMDEAAPARSWSYVFAAGRSGRDYATLVSAVNGTDISTHIVCDRESALAGINVPPNVHVLKSCYDDQYIRELEGASLVVVPLLVDDISAGQMVLIQAMAYRKPIIITRTTTIQEYVSDQDECLLVPRNDVGALRHAIQVLQRDAAQAARLGNSARRAYDERFCMRAYVSNLVAAVQGTGTSGQS